MAEGDRDAYRRQQAALAREREIMKDVKGWEVSLLCKLNDSVIDCDPWLLFGFLAISYPCISLAKAFTTIRNIILPKLLSFDVSPVALFEFICKGQIHAHAGAQVCIY
jgi:hypothetical protein